MKYKWKKTEQIFNTEQDLINHLRSLGDVTFNDASDEYILNESYQNDEWECIEVKIDLENLEFDYEGDGVEYEVWKDKTTGKQYVIPIEIQRNWDEIKEYNGKFNIN
tara:strand:- start:1006 stop:1326 length:321 start_codon:yes stop_codon:yes gene_type:complete